MSKFRTGKLVVSSNVTARTDRDDAFRKFVAKSFERYADGDWSEATPEIEAKENDAAIESGSGIILASYRDIMTGLELWFMTDIDEEITTIMFPSEY